MPSPPPRQPPPEGAGCRRRAAAAALILGILSYLGALALLSTPPVRRALRKRAAAELAGRFPDARIEGPVTVDAAFRLVLGPVVLDAPGTGGALLRVDRIRVRPRLGGLLTGHLEAAGVALQGVRIEAGRHGDAPCKAVRPGFPARARGARPPR
jgi:hypothetical protein